MDSVCWSKKLFSMLLEQARGVRSWRQFATECDISYVQMRKLAMMQQENPPRPKLIQRIAANAFNDVDLEDLMFAAGLISAKKPMMNAPHSDGSYSKLRSLSAKDRREAEDFINFLYKRSEEERDSLRK